MAAQRRSLLQSVRNRPALRAGGWEPKGGLSGAGAAPSPPLGRLLLPGEVWPPASPLPVRPPSLPRTGARAAAHAHCRLVVGGWDSRSSDPERQGRVEGGVRPGAGREGGALRRRWPRGEPTAGTERQREKNSHSRSSRWCTAYHLPGFLPIALRCKLSLC